MAYSDIIEEYEDQLIKDDPIEQWHTFISEIANKNSRWNAPELQNYDDTYLVIKSIANEWNVIKYGT